MLLIIISTDQCPINDWHYALIWWLNSTVAGLGSPFPCGVIYICIRAMCGSPLESKHFLSVHCTNFIHASTWPLL